MPEPVMRRYMFKLYPNATWRDALSSQLGLHSALYNGLIQQRIEAYMRPQPGEPVKLRRIVEQIWNEAAERYVFRPVNCYERAGRTLTAFDQGKEITALRAAMPEYAALSRGSLEQTVKRVHLAFEAFFRRAKAGGGAQAGFPRYKHCDSFGMREQAKGGWHFDFKRNRLRLQGIPGDCTARGKIPSPVLETRTCEIMHRGGAWWLSIVVRVAPRMRRDDAKEGTLAFDLIDVYARLQEPDEQPADTGPDVLGDWTARRVRELQEQMSRCKRGSNRYRKLRTLKQKVQMRAARQTQDNLHRWTTEIAREFARLRIYCPPILEAVRSAKGTKRDPGAQTKLKAEFNHALLRQRPAGAIAMLEYKLAERGGESEINTVEAHVAMRGNDLVKAAKVNKRAKRRIKHARRSTEMHRAGASGVGRGAGDDQQQGIQSAGEAGHHQGVQHGRGDEPQYSHGARD